MAKSKTTKKINTPEELFSIWWNKIAKKEVEKIENDWIKANKPNDLDEDDGGDHWHVNQMMHNGDASEMTYDFAQEVFLKGYNNEDWKMSMSHSLFCDLDSTIIKAYKAGKKSNKRI